MMNATAQPVTAGQAALKPLVAITLIDYAAQVPYYIHNDYSSYHPLPGLRAAVLLAITLVWFLVGLRRYQSNRRWGYPLLLSFLVVEAAFYVITILSGTFIVQLRNPSALIDCVFVVGYASGLAAAYYSYRIWKHHRRSP